MSAATPVTLFYSYAHKDEALRDELSIEIVTARSTDEALQAIAVDCEGFRFVISAWSSPAQAGLRLLASLRQADAHWPLIFYHGANTTHSPQRASQAGAAGALGEAVLLSKLMALVVKVL